MTISAGLSSWKMSRNGKSPGWSAFDLKHRQKQEFEPRREVDSYPPLRNVTSAIPAKSLEMNFQQSIRSFSSVIRPPTVSENLKFGDTHFPGETSVNPRIEKMKKLHSWADESLIEDVLSAVNNDEEQASSLLKSLASPSSAGSEKNFPKPSPVLEDWFHGEETKQGNEVILLESKPLNGSNMELISGRLLSAPLEPEWEEDDIYLSNRKDAIRMMRSATQHSRAANNAYMKGDHISAQQLSAKAREEWLAAEKLNFKAAEEILLIRNNANDPWKLDLHGLHASEAVCALEDHLNEIETHMPIARSVYSDELIYPDGAIGSTMLKPPLMEAKAEEQQRSRGRHRVLQVITGIGTHSRGQAALPTAVRNFLVESGYRFDDARPGVFNVRPKFRHR